MVLKVQQLHSRAGSLTEKFQQGGGTAYIDQAIVLDRQALALRSSGHPKRAVSLTWLAIHLGDRYNQLGSRSDLEEAIELDREALELRPQGHPDRSMSLNNLAGRLSTRYRQLGVTEDLYEAIVLGREALDMRPRGHPDRPSSLINLAVDLASRFEQLGVMTDLDKAIVLDREALGLCPTGHPDRSESLSDFAVNLFTRYNQLGNMEDLDEAIVLDREALTLRPRGHPDRSESLNNLAVDLCTRYNQVGIMGDLDEAISIDREALDLCPKGHLDRSSSLNNLAIHLSIRYKKLGVMEDIDDAISLLREALHLRQRGHPDRSLSLNNLANSLCDRFAASKHPEDKEELFSLYTQLVHESHIASVSSSDVSVARAWIRVAEEFHHSTILVAYETSFHLLIQHLATLPSLPLHLHILKNLSSSLAVDAFSACVRHCSPAKAVELLEQGRGVFWNQLTRLRSPLDDVIMSGMAGKLLAEDFTRLASQIRDASDSPGLDQHGQLCHLNLEMQRIVTNIRQLPGLSRFLLPSLFSDLRQAASGEPVIIVNASRYSCDVLIIFADCDPSYIPLQITQESVGDLANELHSLTARAMKVDMTRALAAFLRKLWDRIVSPVVDFLRTTHPLRSRIWWCPTAEFSMLPLHAAGPYRKGQKNLPDLYISSYTSTLTALIRARQHDPSNLANQNKGFVVIGQANAAGESELLSVGAELASIAQLVHGVATFTRVDGEASCISRVVEEIGQNEWVHFACHGLPNRTQPFESAFALRDGRFTIQRIIGCDLKNPEFAYLSACHTMVGDEENPDEVIHLASAMQFIGFRSVIGTMWAVDDGETNKITSAFYKHMMNGSGRLDYTRAAFALNKAMKAVKVPLDRRILYIHLGA